MNFLISVFHQLADLYAAHPIAQSIGVVGMIFCCASYQGRTPKQILTRQSIAGVMWAIHFFILGANTGACLNLLGSGRNFVYVNNGKKRWASSIAWPIGLAVICVAVAVWSGLFNGEGWRCVLSMAAQALACFVLRSQNAKLIRYLSVLISLLWLIYDALAGSIPGTLCEIINQVSLYIAIFRYRKDNYNAKTTGI